MARLAGSKPLSSNSTSLLVSNVRRILTSSMSACSKISGMRYESIRGVPFSLKTQANKGISSRYLLISKFMELGRGTWTDQEEDFIGLRDQFFRHMESYDRILSLRRLRRTRAYAWHYELVEIPKNLSSKRAMVCSESCIRAGNFRSQLTMM